MWKTLRLSRPVLIVCINVLLFGVAPFLSCGDSPTQENPSSDGSTSTERPADSTSSTHEPAPDRRSPPDLTLPDGPKANTPWQEPKGATTPKDSFAAKASNLEIPASDQEKRYCFVIDPATQGDRLLHRFEPEVAHKDVVLRMVLSVHTGDKKEPWDCSDDNSEQTLVFAWIPGLRAFQFPPKSGVLLKKGQRLRLTLQVRNQTGQVVQAASGIKVYHIPNDGKAYKLWANAVTSFEIPAGKSRRAANLCTLKQPIDLLAGVPLMGRFGTRYISELVRPDGTREELMFVDDWSPDKHWRMFAFPYKAAKGDTLALTCSWRNTSADKLGPGWRTSDEICALLTYVDATTTKTNELCGEQTTGPVYKPPPIKYKPGKCAPKDGLLTAQDAKIAARIGSELNVDFGYKGGDWSRADWELTGGEVIFKSALIGNLMQTEHTMAAGQLRSGPDFHLDFVIQAVIKLGEELIVYPFRISASGAYQKGSAAGAFSVDVTCGEFKHSDLTYQIEGNTLQFGGIVKLSTQAGPIDISLKLQFERK